MLEMTIYHKEKRNKNKEHIDFYVKTLSGIDFYVKTLSGKKPWAEKKKTHYVEFEFNYKRKIHYVEFEFNYKRSRLCLFIGL